MTIVLNELQHSQLEHSSKTKLQAFQRKIYLKAKQNPKYKFYCLYDKVFRKDTLEEAYRKVRSNKGAPGIDGITFEALEGKEEEFISEIQEELKRKTYKPNKLREIRIPKKNGGERILKIPTIKDRTVQMAVKLIIEPIFEADFKDCSYGYRPKKSAHQAITKLNKTLFSEIYKPEEKRREIKSIDLKDCFNTIPHKELLQIIARRINDRQMLKLIKMILKSGGMEITNGGNGKSGTPQGGVLSPLLANIYLNLIDEYWQGRESKSDMVRYADDIVIVLKKGEEEKYEKFLRFIEEDMRLEVNREKTKTETVQGGVKYLGFTLRQKTSGKHKQYLSMEPNKESLKSVKLKIREIIKRKTPESTADIVAKVNQVLRGWQQYFDNISMGNTRQQIKHYTELRLMKMISGRNKKRRIKWKLFKGNALYQKYGLYELKSMNRIFT